MYYKERCIILFFFQKLGYVLQPELLSGPIGIENVTALWYKAVTAVYVSKHSLLYVTPFSFKPH